MTVRSSCVCPCVRSKMGSLMAGDDFQHILRLLNTNVDGKNKIMYALTSIKGMGRRFSNLVCKKAEVDLRKRAGEYNLFYPFFKGRKCFRTCLGQGLLGTERDCVARHERTSQCHAVDRDRPVAGRAS